MSASGLLSLMVSTRSRIVRNKKLSEPPSRNFCRTGKQPSATKLLPNYVSESGGLRSNLLGCSIFVKFATEESVVHADQRGDKPLKSFPVSLVVALENCIQVSYF